jgi:hypothetical protein
LKNIRAGSGLGDSIYLRPIVEYFVRQGEQVVALSNFPDVFIGSGASVEPFRRDRVDVIGHYTEGKKNEGTTQFQDMCQRAKIPDIQLQFDWAIKNHALIERLQKQANGRPIVIIHGGRAPMARTDGFGIELLPEKSAFDAVLNAIEGCMVVAIGSKDGQKYTLKSEIDLTGQTTVADMFDIASICSGIVAQCCFAIPLAEALNKPILTIWSDRGIRCNNEYVNTITPKKILSKPTSCFVMDNWPEEQIQGVVRAFCKF